MTFNDIAVTKRQTLRCTKLLRMGLSNRFVMRASYVYPPNLIVFDRSPHPACE